MSSARAVKCACSITAGWPYGKTEDSKKAVEHFLKFLQQKPDDLEVRWLSISPT